MRRFRLLRAVLALLLISGWMMTIGCGELFRKSVREGLFTALSGSVQNSFDAALFGDLIMNLLAGGTRTTG